MNAEELDAALNLAQAGNEDDWRVLPEGKTLTLHVSSAGVGLAVSKVEAVRLSGTLVHARSARGDLYALVATDVFAFTIDGGETRGRKAGFST
jgi:hypothetical protein